MEEKDETTSDYRDRIISLGTVIDEKDERIERTEMKL